MEVLQIAQLLAFIIFISDSLVRESLRGLRENFQTQNPNPSGVHALSIVAKTPEQWEKMSNNDIDPSPKCRGGFGK